MNYSFIIIENLLNQIAYEINRIYHFRYTYRFIIKIFNTWCQFFFFKNQMTSHGIQPSKSIYVLLCNSHLNVLQLVFWVKAVIIFFTILFLFLHWHRFFILCDFLSCWLFHLTNSVTNLVCEWTVFYLTEQQRFETFVSAIIVLVGEKAYYKLIFMTTSIILYISIIFRFWLPIFVCTFIYYLNFLHFTSVSLDLIIVFL